jgi:hypothetical protein
MDHHPTGRARDRVFRLICNIRTILRSDFLRTVRRAAVVIGLSVINGVPAFCQTSRLFMLSATISPGLDLPARLYSLDPEAGGDIKLVRDIADGVNCVLPDYQMRRLAVVTSWRTTGVTVIHIDHPEKELARPFEYDGKSSAVGIYLLNVPDKGEGVALELGSTSPQGRYEPAQSLLFFGTKPGESPISIPLDSVKFIRSSGEAGGALNIQAGPVEVRGDPLKVPMGSPDGVSTGIPAPPYLKGRAASDISLVISSSESRLVIIPRRPAESGVIDVLDRKTGVWQREPIPFPSARIRAFGDWLAMIETRPSWTKTIATSVIRKEERGPLHESPGKEKRRLEEIAPPFRNDPAMTVDDLFEQMHIAGEYYTGELALFNLSTGVQLHISTGTGDSEIVLATDEAVYYRVDDALYMRQISGNTLSEPVKLAEGEEIVQVHWAFLNRKLLD